MELTPQELREVEFRERWRGYDPDDVDDFLERAAVALDEFDDRLREYTERAMVAEQRLTEGADTEGALRHTLVLAQRTADNAVAEAQETAARMLRDAEERSRAIVGEARQEADRAAEESQRQLRVDVTLLETAKVQLQADIDALEQYLSEERAHVRSSLTELMWRLEERVSGGLSPRPELNDPRIPAPPGSDREPVSSRMPEFLPAAAATPVAETDSVSPGPEGPLRAPRLVYKRTTPSGDRDGAHDDAPDDTITAERDSASVPADEEAFAPDDSEVIQWPGRKNRPLPADDAFFEALRDALDDDKPLGPRDDLPAAAENGGGPYDDALPGGQRSGSRFRRRR
jgi:cell division initiation protein